MTRTRTLAPILGTAALAATLFTAAPARAHTTYTVTVTDITSSVGVGQAYGLSGNTQVGDAASQAILWTGTSASAVSLHPAGDRFSYARGVSGNTQVGYSENFSGQGGGPITITRHALLWHGTAASVVDLNPAGFTDSFAFAVSGDTQAGFGAPSDGHAYQCPLLWHGTADSVVDLTPPGTVAGEIYGISGGTQVGDAGFADSAGNYLYTHAVLWHGTADSAVDLNPTGFRHSAALGADGDTQVGSGDSLKNGTRALLWKGSAASVRDLTPSGFYEGTAYAASGGAQAGEALARTTQTECALLWTGTAQSAINLTKFLPAGFHGDSEAHGVEVKGNVVRVAGWAYSKDYSDLHAFLWRVTFPDQPTLLQLDPATRTAGRGAFSLAVHGTGFTSKSVVTWNGAAQPTVLVSPFEVRASVPAALTAATGTASVRVVTPGYAPTLTRTVTVHS